MRKSMDIDCISCGFSMFPRKNGTFISREKGFTLLEIIAVMVILSILAAVAIPKYVSVDESARQRALDAGISELNGRETLTWSNEKISASGWISDEKTFGLIDKDLGTEYSWDSADPADESGGTLIFKESSSANLNRTVSTYERPGSWSR
jgi:prepilin-type N-terminal cleavage/methylation domain-containing protein